MHGAAQHRTVFRTRGHTTLMELDYLAEGVQSRHDLVAFIYALRGDLATNEAAWENPTLDRYLNALASWTNDMDGYFRNQGQEMPPEPTWQLIAFMLYAAHLYE
jgi:hypothetical protein